MIIPFLIFTSMLAGPMPPINSVVVPPNQICITNSSGVHCYNRTDPPPVLNVLLSWKHVATNVLFNVYATNDLRVPLGVWPRVATTPNLFWTDQVLPGARRFYFVRAMDIMWRIESN